VRLDQAPDVLTVEQAAEVLVVSRGTAYEAIRTGEIPSVRIGRCIRIPRHALERFLTVNGHGCQNDSDAATTPRRVEESAGRGRHDDEG